MGQELDPRIREACQLLDSAQSLEQPVGHDFHHTTLQQRMSLAAGLRSRAAALRRQVHGR